MESEIQFLLKILLEQKLNPAVKQLFLTRIGEVETSIRSKGPVLSSYQPVVSNGQAASTQALLAKHGMETPEVPGIVIASQAAAQAVQSRNQAIQQAVSGKAEPGRTSPRKF